MQANSAKSDPVTLALVVYDNVKLLDVTGPLQVFSDARRPDGSVAYAVSLVSPEGQPVSTDTMLPLAPQAPSDVPRPDTLMVAGGRGALIERYSPDLQALVTGTAPLARRVCSVCLGAFILAEAGLLQGKKATTHWKECHRLAEEYPDITVMGDEIFVNDGKIWTSAGVSSGIDLALALVEEDLGRAEALRIARLLVLPIKRQGGQSQFTASLRHQLACPTSRFDALLTAIQEQPGQKYTVPEMAARSNMSERNFARAFKAETGQSPAHYVEQIRVEAARDALLDRTMPMAAAAAQFGFGSEENMRRAFKRQFGTTPSALLQQFSSA
ncbi:MAG: helix-turn-helix domain-containing protein [Pseudomonadota bacterium]